MEHLQRGIQLTFGAQTASLNIKKLFETSSSEEGDGALQAGKDWHQGSITVIQAAEEPDLTTRSFQHYWNAQYLF